VGNPHTSERFPKPLPGDRVAADLVAELSGGGNIYPRLALILSCADVGNKAPGRPPLSALQRRF
jgi:hypothetical protein